MAMKESGLFAYNESAVMAGESFPKMGFFPLIMSTITLIVGGGVFSLCSDMVAAGADGQAIINAWIISGVGVLCLVLTFFTLSRVKPQLKGGIYSYAANGFGQFTGFASAWGYWISATFCIISYCPLLFSAIGYFVPAFGDGTNLPSLVGASIIVWFYVILVSRGVTQAAFVNAIVALAKLIPIFTAIIAIVFLSAFDPATFIANLHVATTDPDSGSLLADPDKVAAALTTTIWVFLGIEGAVAISGRAKKTSDVGKATIVAFCCVLAIYLMISLLALGVLPLDELGALDNPPLAGLMAAAVGDWGAILVNVGVIISLIGSMLGYTVLTSEVPFESAESGVGFPKFFARSNDKKAPIGSLLVSGIIVQVFLFVMLFSNNTYQFFYGISVGLILLPYLLCALYFVKVSFCEAGIFAGKVKMPVWFCRILAVVAVVYSLVLFYATGTEGFAITCFIYAPGALVYVFSKYQHGEHDLFATAGDKILLVAVLIGLAASIYFVAAGLV